MSRPAGALDRALAAITIGMAQGQQFRERVLADTRTGEYEQQIQLSVSGTAGNGWGFADAQVMFEYPFLFAPTQRMVPFDRPHFQASFELMNASDTLVHLAAHVIDWNVNDSGWIIGATVRVVGTAPAVSDSANLEAFSALAHLTFQGYCTYAEGDEYTQ